MDKLGYLPLAIDHAGCYIYNQDISLVSYISTLEKNTQQVLAKLPAKHASTYDQSVFTTWETSYNAIKRKSTVAAQMLIYASFYAASDVITEIFLRGRAFEGSANYFDCFIY